MLVDLAYGRTGLTVELPDERTTVIEPIYFPALPKEKDTLLKAIREPIGKPPLRELARTTHRVAISVCDITRPMPSRTVLPVLLKELDHVPKDQIVILVATGTHRANTLQEIEEMLGREIIENYQVVNHNGFDKDQLKLIGKTSDGIPILLNRHWLESDFRITTGFVEPHFFAGFSGGPKMVAPGLAGFETIMGLHSAPLIGHPKSKWGAIDGNPIQDAIRHIVRGSGVDFSIDVTINRDHRITSVHAGDVFDAHREACQMAREVAMRQVVEPFDVVITTNSGYPLDINLYQSVKGMSAAAQVVRPGGAIICAAECKDGIPDHGEYKEILASRNSPQELLDMINSPEYHHHDQWQVQLQAQILLRAQVYLKSSYLSTEQVKSAHLEPAEDLQDTVMQSIERYGGDATVCVLPQGPQTIPYVKNDSG